MKTDTEIKIEGTKTLMKILGQVDAERYILLMTREPFDYTIWQKDLWDEKSVEDISKAAMTLRKES